MVINSVLFVTFKEAISHMFDFDIPGEIYSSLIVMLIICIFSFIIYFKFRKADPYEERPHGFVLIISSLVQYVRNFTIELMGKKWEPFAGYVLALFAYIFMAFTFSLTGLPSPASYLAVPLSLGLCTFVLIHVTAMRANKWKYFYRYFDPFPPYIPVFLPINLLSMWSPLLSLTLRLFGNALSGYVLMSIIYAFFAQASSFVFGFISSGVNQIFIAPLVTPVLHLYFDLFSGGIQALVFVMLTMIFVSQEDPDTSEEEMLTLKKPELETK